MRTKPIRGTLPNKLHPLIPTAAWIMNEGSGNKIYDIIGRNHGTFGAGAAAPSWVPGRNGPALDFDGANYIEIDSNSRLQNANNFSISVGIYANALADNDGLVAGSTGGDNYKDFILGVLSGGNDIFFQILEDSNPYITASFNKNEWTDITVTLDSSNYGKIYINGVLGGEGSLTAVASPWASIYYIGRYSTLTHFHGLIDKVEFYNRALSASEIQQLYVNPYCWLAQPMDLASLYVSIGQEYTESVIIELQSKYNHLSIEEYQLLKILINKYNQFESFNLEKIIKKISQSEMRKRVV